MTLIVSETPAQDALIAEYKELTAVAVSSSTKDQIYDAAEQAFGEKGFHGAAIREIFKIAGVNTGLMSYYFSSKEDLYTQCLQRRMELVNRIFLTTMAALKKDTHGKPSPYEIVRAYVRFFLTLVAHRELGLSDYIKLLAQTANVYGNEDFAEIMKPFSAIIDTTIDMLSEAIPYLDRDIVARNFHFLEFGIVTMICGDQIRLLRFGDVKDADQLETIAAHMAAFYSRGMLTT